MSEETWIQAPTKTYRGHMGAPGEFIVSVNDGTGVRLLTPKNAAVGFSWGGKGRTPGEMQLALAILDDALGDEQQATRLYQRFKHRTISLLSEGVNWSMPLKNVLAVVAQIEAAEQQTAPARHMAATQVAPVGIVGALPFPVVTGEMDRAPDRGMNFDSPATAKARETALAKLTIEERKALGLP